MEKSITIEEAKNLYLSGVEEFQKIALRFYNINEIYNVIFKVGDYIVSNDLDYLIYKVINVDTKKNQVQIISLYEDDIKNISLLSNSDITVIYKNHTIITKFDPITFFRSGLKKIVYWNEETNQWKAGELGYCMNNEWFLCSGEKQIKQFVPYNFETKELIGTNNSINDFYIFWKRIYNEITIDDINRACEIINNKTKKNK